MGDGITGHISKGVVHTLVDACINHQNPAGQFDKRAAFLQALQLATTSQQYRALIESQAGVPPGASQYLGTVWYNETGNGNWQTLQPIYSILRMGLIKAITLAGTDRFLDSYWLPLPFFPFVEVLVARARTQVIRLIVTPPSEAPGMKRTVDADMWVVRKQASPEEVKGFETMDQFVEEVTRGDYPVVTWRRREQPVPGMGAAGTRP
jgi:hypothetical protein